MKKYVPDIILTLVFAALLFLCFAAPVGTREIARNWIARISALAIWIALCAAFSKLVDSLKLDFYFFFVGCLMLLFFVAILSSGAYSG